MNCKPGDMAIIIRDAKACATAGMMVEVLYAVPAGIEFITPDGFIHYPVAGGRWMCRPLGSSFRVPMDRGAWYRQARYAPIPDGALRPLPGDEAAETNNKEMELSQ